MWVMWLHTPSGTRIDMILVLVRGLTPGLTAPCTKKSFSSSLDRVLDPQKSYQIKYRTKKSSTIEGLEAPEKPGLLAWMVS